MLLQMTTDNGKTWTTVERINPDDLDNAITRVEGSHGKPIRLRIMVFLLGQVSFIR